MSRAKTNNTEATKKTNTSAEVSAEVKTSVEATKTATAEKKTESKKQSAERTKKTSAKAGKTEPKKTEEKEVETIGYNAEKGIFTLLVPTAKRDELGQLETKLKVVSYTVPKTVKKDQRINFVKLVEAQILDYLTTECSVKLAELEEKKTKSESGEYTESQQAKVDQYKALNELVTATRKRFKLSRAVYDDFAYLLACDVLNKAVKVELASVKTALSTTSAELDGVMLDFMGGKSVNITKDQQELLTECKSKIKGVLDRFAKETTWCDAFKLGISNKDILMWYKLGYVGLKNRKPVYAYSEDTCKKLEKELAQFYLYKVDFVENK